jgi:hypothetical protein
MDAQQGNSIRQIAHDKRKRGFNLSSAILDIALETDSIKHAPLGRHAG